MRNTLLNYLSLHFSKDESKIKHKIGLQHELAVLRKLAALPDYVWFHSVVLENAGEKCQIDILGLYPNGSIFLIEVKSYQGDLALYPPDDYYWLQRKWRTPGISRVRNPVAQVTRAYEILHRCLSENGRLTRIFQIVALSGSFNLERGLLDYIKASPVIVSDVNQLKKMLCRYAHQQKHVALSNYEEIYSYLLGLGYPVHK